MDEESGKFKVQDKRRFKDVGTQEAEGPVPAASSVESPRTAPQEPVYEKEAGSPEDVHAPFPEINFSSFVFSLGHTAFSHLGEEPDPVTGEKKVSLPLAKEIIDILNVLEEKTRGNLSPDEEHLMKNLLYALRVKYVEKATRS